ncbi:MAG: insulinase family protein [Gemmatimonadetes bacterium]|nr:insulinase family protein [Gemmatimonadota bacterium]
MLLLALSLAAGPVLADTVIRPAASTGAAAGLVTVQRQPAIPIVALRLSLLADDPPGYAGAGHLVQHLVLPTLQEQARRVGGEVQAARSADAVVYTAIGPAVELDYLAGVLRGALRTPPAGEGAVLQALRALEIERAAEWETAASHVRAELRAGLFPEDLSPAGTPSSAARFSAEVLPAVWAQMYRPERVAVVAVGDVETARVRAAFAQLPSSAGDGLPELFPDTVSTAPPAPPEATRGWLGVGYPVSDANPAAVTVAARLLRDLLRQKLPTSSVEAEHWWTRQGQALVAVVAAPPAALALARRNTGTAIATLRDAVDAAAVRDAAAGVRRDMLFYARRPERMADVLGQFADRQGDPEAAQSFYAAVAQVTEDDVRAVLDSLADRTPTLVDIPPQKLPGSTPARPSTPTRPSTGAGTRRPTTGTARPTNPLKPPVRRPEGRKP